MNEMGDIVCTLSLLPFFFDIFLLGAIYTIEPFSSSLSYYDPLLFFSEFKTLSDSMC